MPSIENKTGVDLMLWNGHRGYASVLLKLAKDIGLLDEKVFPQAFKDAVTYSVYPDAIFQDRLRAKYFPGLEKLKCPWKSCGYKFPCVPSPDMHHVRWCSKRSVMKSWEAFRQSMSWKQFGIMTHFLADLVCEQYEGILKKTPREQWDYRAKAVPLSNEMEKISLNYSLNHPTVSSAVKKFERINSLKFPSVLLDIGNEWAGIILFVEDVVSAIGYSARSKVQRRMFNDALSDLIALGLWLLKKGLG